MDNINNGPLQPQEPSLWQRFKRGDASDKVQIAALAFAKTVEAAAKGISSTIKSAGAKITSRPTVQTMVSAAKKTDTFFRNGLIGQAIGSSTAWSAAEVAAGQVGSILASYPSRTLGAMAGALAVQSIPVAAVTTAAVGIALYIANRRQLSALQGIATILGLSTIIALYYQHANDLKGMGENVGSAFFEMLGSLIASIVVAYQVSKHSSGLSFEEYLKRNLQSVAAVAAFNSLGTTHPVVQIPYNIIIGMLAYNAVPIRNLVITVRNAMNSRQRDISSRIKEHLQATQQASLEAAYRGRATAEARGEDLTTHDAHIQELEKRPFLLGTVFDNLDKISRTSFASFVAYQSILESSAIESKQKEFIEASRIAGRFQERLTATGVESTDEYIEALASNPEIGNDPERFANECKLRYQVAIDKAEADFRNALKTGIKEETSMTALMVNTLFGGLINRQVESQLDNLPKIRDIETTLFGFPLTGSVDANITERLIRIHMEYFLAIATAPIASNTLSAIGQRILRQAPSESILLDRRTELKFIEGLLKLGVNHYSRTSPDSAIVRTANNTLPLIFTSLREGVTAAFAEWRSSRQGFENVEFEELDGEEFELIDIEELDNGTGRPFSTEPLNEEASDDAVYFDAQADIAIENQEEEFFDSIQELNPQEKIVDMPDDEALTADEIAEAVQATPAQPANRWSFNLFRRFRPK